MRPPNAAPTSSFPEFQGLERSRPCCLPRFPCRSPHRAFRTPGRRPWQGRGTGAELRPPLSSPTCPQPHPASQSLCPLPAPPRGLSRGPPSDGAAFLLLLPLAPSPALTPPARSLQPGTSHVCPGEHGTQDQPSAERPGLSRPQSSIAAFHRVGCPRDTHPTWDFVTSRASQGLLVSAEVAVLHGKCGVCVVAVVF